MGVSNFVVLSQQSWAQLIQEEKITSPERENKQSQNSTSPENQINEKIFIEKFWIIGNKALKTEELLEILAPFQNKNISRPDLLSIASLITKFYSQKGYFSSFASIPLQSFQEGVVIIEIVEGYLEKIEVEVDGSLSPDYVRARLEKRLANKPANQNEIDDALKLLIIDPFIEDLIAMELNPGSRSELIVLSLKVKAAPAVQVIVGTDNTRSVFVGENNRRIVLGLRNILVSGNECQAGYTNTDGSNAIDFLCRTTLNSNNARLTFAYGKNSNEIIANAFAPVNPETDFEYGAINFSHPVIESSAQELTLGISANRLKSKSTVLGRPFPLSRGADANGETKISALEFWQKYTQRNPKDKLSVISQIRLGLGAFNANTSSQSLDSRFLLWRVGTEYIRKLDETNNLVLGGFLQLSSEPLPGLEQISIGGPTTVRGYRQSVIATDNGFLGSIELRTTIWKINENIRFQLTPFMDFGTGWNNSDKDFEQQFLLSLGLGIRLVRDRRFEVRAGYGFPLIKIEDNNITNSFQERGWFFLLNAKIWEF